MRIKDDSKGGAGETKGRAAAGQSGKTGLLLSFGLVLMCWNVAVAEEAGDGRPSFATPERTSIYADEEEPRVRRSMAWQLPTPVQQEPQAPGLSGAEGLLDPIDVEALQTHRRFRKTLDILSIDWSEPAG